jgi:hypothetical protein
MGESLSEASLATESLATESRATASRATWFRDPRSPVRRLRASWHPENGLVVLSVWDRERCSATFRLPIEDAPALMHFLVDALADASTAQPPTVESGWERMLDRLRRRFRRRSVGPVVPLRRSE